MHCVKLAPLLYCLYDSMANHSQYLLCFLFHELFSGTVIIYKTFAWWMVTLLCTMYTIWLNYQLYYLLSVMRLYSRVTLLLIWTHTTPNDKIPWLFKFNSNYNGEQLCCLTTDCTNTPSLINELLEHT
jgi:cytochrome b subunit of formate dehydrogenase